MEGKFDSKAPDRPHPRLIYIPKYKKEEKTKGGGETERRIKVDFEGEKQRSQCEMLQKRGRVAY